jgi:hypothetical protein
MTREAVRLAAESAVVDAAQQAASSTTTDWSRVRKLGQGTEITITSTTSHRVARNLIAADESGLTVLNLFDPMLPVAAREALRDLAEISPALLIDAQRGGTYRWGNGVRVGPEGVFMADQKVADVEQIIERTRRAEVIQVTKRAAPGHPIVTGTLVGLAVGIATATFLSILFCEHGGCGVDVSFASLLASLGAGAGAGIGAVKAAVDSTETVIYRAP